MMPAAIPQQFHQRIFDDTCPQTNTDRETGERGFLKRPGEECEGRHRCWTLIKRAGIHPDIEHDMKTECTYRTDGVYQPRSGDGGPEDVFITASYFGNLKLVREILEERPSLSTDELAMDYAISRNHEEVLFTLIDVDTSPEKVNRTRALLEATRRGNADLVQKILRRVREGSPGDFAEYVRNSRALILAAKGKTFAVVEILIDADRSEEHLRANHSEALRTAADYGRRRNVEALLAADPSPRNARNLKDFLSARETDRANPGSRETRAVMDRIKRRVLTM